LLSEAQNSYPGVPSTLTTVSGSGSLKTNEHRIMANSVAYVTEQVVHHFPPFNNITIRRFSDRVHPPAAYTGLFLL